MVVTKKQIDIIYACKKKYKIKCSKKLLMKLYSLQKGDIELKLDYEEIFYREFNNLIYLLCENDYFLAQFSLDFIDDMHEYCFTQKKN